jgi:hypothetical protein
VWRVIAKRVDSAGRPSCTALIALRRICVAWRLCASLNVDGALIAWRADLVLGQIVRRRNHA